MPSSSASVVQVLRRTFRSAGIAAAILLSPGFAAAAKAADIVVFAAASLKTALDSVAGSWKAETGKKAIVSYAASSALARQIEAGAPADVFISADLDWMEELAAKGLIKPQTRSNLLGNRLVLVAPADSGVSLRIGPGMDLPGALAGGKLAMGEPNSVPAGRYGKAALQTLGVWDAVSGSVAAAENVRAALALVSRGEAPLGIVYRTDAAADKGVKVVGTFPEASHPPIVYPVAVVAASQNGDAQTFIEYLRFAKAAAAFEIQGFKILR